MKTLQRLTLLVCSIIVMAAGASDEPRVFSESDSYALSILAASSAECARAAVTASPVAPVPGSRAVPLRIRLASCPTV